MLSKRQTDTEEFSYYMIHLYEKSRTGKSIETKSRLMVTSDWDEGEMENNCLLGMGFLLGDAKGLELEKR